VILNWCSKTPVPRRTHSVVPGGVHRRPVYQVRIMPGNAWMPGDFEIQKQFKIKRSPGVNG
jgi:hypothetical protein